MGLRMKNLNITGVHWKIFDFQGRGGGGGGGGGQVNKKQNIGKRAWTICRFKGGIVKKEGGLNFVAIILNQILLCL